MKLAITGDFKKKVDCFGSRRDRANRFASVENGGDFQDCAILTNDTSALVRTLHRIPAIHQAAYHGRSSHGIWGLGLSARMNRVQSWRASTIGWRCLNRETTARTAHLPRGEPLFRRPMTGCDTVLMAGKSLHSLLHLVSKRCRPTTWSTGRQAAVSFFERVASRGDAAAGYRDSAGVHRDRDIVRHFATAWDRMVADEISAQALRRAGKMFAMEHFGVAPDLTCHAREKHWGAVFRCRALSAGPISSIALPPGGLGGTFGGNPVACAAALAVLDVIEEESLLEKAPRAGCRPYRRPSASGKWPTKTHAVASASVRKRWRDV